ncbi:hypothetical protein TNCT_402131 [Trichonephila clavata]|uniref:Uncharacterized protein n=1 Tax=Trichonephila clavata TaxID=2740835 RepID=A0A8X6F0T5_TRICU|nr:hypothetical protein TNCT_402131 [Trichonephila clavata]
MVRNTLMTPGVKIYLNSQHEWRADNGTLNAMMPSSTCPDVLPLHAVLPQKAILMKKDIIWFSACSLPMSSRFGILSRFFVFSPFADRLTNGACVRSGVQSLSFLVYQLMFEKHLFVLIAFRWTFGFSMM